MPVLSAGCSSSSALIAANSAACAWAIHGAVSGTAAMCDAFGGASRCDLVVSTTPTYIIVVRTPSPDASLVFTPSQNAPSEFQDGH